MSDPMTRLNAALEGRYHIERELGQGGMATVYLAHDLKHDRKVALKVLKPELAAVVGADRFLAEIRTTANLQHPHILPLFDSGEADSFLFYVMPYVEGESLRERLDRAGELPVEESVRITAAVANALDYAHRHGVIHRDIKPANILLHDGHPLVADFGIALAVSAAGGGRLTETGLSLGTPFYMSPEQATADRDPSAASDIYSLGCVAYEMLVGEPPYTGASAQAVLGKILTTDPVRPTDHRRAIPANVDATVLKALEKRPADRFGSAMELAEALANPSFGAEIRTRTPADASSRHRSIVVPALTVTTMIAGALAVWGWLGKEDKVEGRMILTETTVPMERGSTTYGINFALSPDASQLAYSTGVDGTPRLRVLDRATLESRPLARTEDANAVAFSPDGQQIGFVTNQFVLKVASLQGEAVATLSERVSRAGLDWGHDGYVYFASLDLDPQLGDRGIRRIPPGGGDIETLTELNPTDGEISHLLPQLLPSGRGVLFTISRDRLYEASAMDIAVADLAAGSYKTLLKGIVARAISPDFLLVVTADGALLGVPFDDERLEITGASIPLMTNVGVERHGIADLTVSAAGTVMYGTRGPTDREIVWVDRSGRWESVDPEWVRPFTSLSLAPDEHALAVSVFEGGLEQIWVREFGGPGPRPLRIEGGSNGRIRTWTPDSRAIALWNDYALSVLPSEGGAPTGWVRRGFPGGISFSPDGEWVAFTSSEEGQIDIFVAQRGDSLGKAGVATEFAETSPSISRDGHWLAYASDESGRDEVYVRSFPLTPEGTRWPVSTDGGTGPRWAHDGEELFFIRRGELIAVEIRPGSTFQTGAERPLFSGAVFGGTLGGFDVARDGRFLMMRPIGGVVSDHETVVVAEKVIEELKARTGR